MRWLRMLLGSSKIWAIDRELTRLHDNMGKGNKEANTEIFKRIVNLENALLQSKEDEKK